MCWQEQLLARQQSSAQFSSSCGSSSNCSSDSSIAGSVDASRDSSTRKRGGEGEHTSAAAGLYQLTKKGLLDWLAEGCGWQLQEVLLPSKVNIIHPEYVRGMQDKAGVDLSAKQLEQVFTGQLGLGPSGSAGLHRRPVPGSEALQAAVDAGRWQPLPVMLSESWSGCSQQERQQLAGQLKDMEVSGVMMQHQKAACHAGNQHWLLGPVNVTPVYDKCKVSSSCPSYHAAAHARL